MNMDRTLLAYRRLCACLTIVGKQKEIERVFNDGAYAEELLNDLVFRTRLIGFEYHLDSKRELMQGKSVFGYKVFGPGWLCENSSLRDVDSRDGEIIVYGFGMDFYKSLTECFKYYVLITTTE